MVKELLTQLSVFSDVKNHCKTGTVAAPLVQGRADVSRRASVHTRISKPSQSPASGSAGKHLTLSQANEEGDKLAPHATGAVAEEGSEMTRKGGIWNVGGTTKTLQRLRKVSE